MHGVRTPLLVRRWPTDTLIAGERRWQRRAGAGLNTVPAVGA